MSLLVAMVAMAAMATMGACAGEASPDGKAPPAEKPAAGKEPPPLPAPTGSRAESETPPVRSVDEARAAAEFVARMKEYIALHEKLEASLPKFAKKGTPEQVDANQRALGSLIKEARRDAKPGDFFTPGMQALVKRVMREVLAGPDGATVKASIMDENPGVPKIALNERFPSTVPLSTMPPQVLAPLPKLEGELEFRFLGPRLVLVDTEADIILDYTDNVLSQ